MINHGKVGQVEAVYKADLSLKFVHQYPLITWTGVFLFKSDKFYFKSMPMERIDGFKPEYWKWTYESDFTNVLSIGNSNDN